MTVTLPETTVAASQWSTVGGTSFAHNIDVTHALTSALNDMPSDFDTMTTCTLTVDARLLNLPEGDDVYDHFGAIRKADGTYLAGATATTMQQLRVVTGTLGFVRVTINFSFVDTTATKADWDGANVLLEQRYIKNKGADGNAIDVDYVAIGGTYEQGAPTSTGTIAQTLPKLQQSASGTYVFHRFFELDELIVALPNPGPVVPDGDHRIRVLYRCTNHEWAKGRVGITLRQNGIDITPSGVGFATREDVWWGDVFNVQNWLTTPITDFNNLEVVLQVRVPRDAEIHIAYVGVEWERSTLPKLEQQALGTFGDTAPVKVKFGSASVANAYVGDVLVDRLYLGDNLLLD